MTINHDVYSFELLKNGADVSEVTLNSSYSYLESLQENKLITIEEGRIFLTDRGEAAKLIGVEKYLQLEKYEEKVSRWGIKNRERNIRFIKLVLLLILILTALLTYINVLLT